MDAKDKKKLKHEYARLVAKLDKTLRRFTPMDPSDEYSYGDEYEGAVPLIVSMLLRGYTREELFSKLESTRAEWNQPSNPELDWKITDAVIKSFHAKERTNRKPPSPPKVLLQLDLRTNLEEVLSYFENRVSQFNAMTGTISSETALIRLIVVGYECTQSGWIVIVFDTRPNAESDGEWTVQIEKVRMKREHWRKASVINMRGPICIIGTEGVEVVHPPESELAEPIGALLTDAFLKARTSGLFETLPLAPNCELVIEDFDGQFSWPPDTESSSKVNLIKLR